MSSAQPNAVVMSGVASTPPSGDLDIGALSVSGQRETANAFRVNGANVQEDVNMGVAIVPTLDSVAGLNVLTDSFDAKLGNQSGGQIQVTTKSGTDRAARERVRLLPQHGAGCAQLLLVDACGVSSEPVWRDAGRPCAAQGRVLLCRLPGDAADRGNRYRIDCSADAGGAEREPERRGAGADGHGEWGDWAQQLSARLGTTVTAGEPYAQVFPGGQIPMSAWSAPAKGAVAVHPFAE